MNDTGKLSIFFWLLAMCLSTPVLLSQPPDNDKDRIQLSLDYHFLTYQSAYGFKGSTGVGLAVAIPINETFKGEIGMRLGINPALPEGFLRGTATQSFGAWKPAVGIETGVTNRANFEDSTNLLKETREAMLKDIGNCYISTHIEPLAFDLKTNFGFSLLELDVGTHFKHFGRTVRAQATIVKMIKYF